MPEPVRVRFAPSPTGFMHVGNVHTALFNWLFARHVGGAMILRIEDTDEVRSTPEALDVIYRGLTWLGLDWDEGPDIGGAHAPYVQSERLEIYNEHVQRLIEAGQAYRCCCTPQELENRRQVMQAQGLPPRYDGRCRNADNAADGEHCIRFTMKETGKTVVNDLIQGEVVYDNSLVGDPVIVKTSGYPTYHFAVVVDDALMGISHVIRAVEHLPNTQIHLQLQEALGLSQPVYAHLPIVLGTDRTKLSKRHGAVSVTEYEEMGFLPEAMFNFLSLMGWSPGNEDEILNREEIISRFTLESCSKAPAVFDLQKAEWLNSEHIKRMAPQQLAALVLPLLQEAGLFEMDPSDARMAWLTAVCDLMKERTPLLTTLVSWGRYYFTDEYEFENRAREKWLADPQTPAVLELLADSLEAVGSWDAEAIETAIRELAVARGVKAAQLIHPCRAAVTGTTIGPSLFHLLELLPQETVTDRLRRVAAMGREGLLMPDAAADETQDNGS